ncbi:M28 family metallopeptidase [Phenylobacterium sp.]|uniref:M28 family metallopeptidase n=1 Tax=Phenylobacterium sp. TaxID=1871053 RepID=UPI0037CA8E06
MSRSLALLAAIATALAPMSAQAGPKVCASCVTSTMKHLTGAKLAGRACGTDDDLETARYLARRFKAYGVKGAAPGGGYLQSVQFRVPTYASLPVLQVGEVRFVHGEGILALTPMPDATASLVVLSKDGAPAEGAGRIVVFDGLYDPATAAALVKAGALAVIATPPDRFLKAWDQLATRPPGPVEVLGVEAPTPRPAGPPVVFARPETLATLKLRAGTSANITATLGAPILRTTYNVLAEIPGRSGPARREVVLLSAHHDHLGVIGGQLYPGANDDASGTAAVLEFARMMKSGRGHKRRVQFALFGCEEQGGHGSRYYLAHPPAPLGDVIANLQFEMIGVPDPRDRQALMLTGWERSNLGPALKARGASLGPDPYPQENFFMRSDNYQLARKGVVAQTISAWPLPPSYHQPSDTLENLDLPFMIGVIQSLADPIRWLLDSDFKPDWNPGMKP